MMIKNIIESEWAQSFLKDNRWQFDTAVDYAHKLAAGKGEVVITQLDDHSFKGDFLWVIIPDFHPEFWMEGVKNLHDAVSLCEEMGWTIKEIGEEKTC